MGTWPNLAFSIGLVLHFASNPREVHVKTIKRILSYLRATTNIGLTFGESSNQRLVRYADANYANCTLRQCSTSEYVFLHGRAVLEWRSKKQECVALLTTKAKYISLNIATKKVVWLWGLLNFLESVQRSPIVIHQDNQSTIALVESKQTLRKTNQIDLQFY